MKCGMIAAVAGLAVSGVASAAFTGYTVVATNTSNSGQNLVRYEVFAVFNGATDTVLNCYNFALVSSQDADGYGGFWHKDLNEHQLERPVAGLRHVESERGRRLHLQPPLRLVPPDRRNAERHELHGRRPLLGLGWLG